MPSRNAMHQDAALENISIGYQPQGLVAHELSSNIPVKHESDKYYVWSKDNMRIPETRRADGAESNEVDWNLSTASYTVEFEALKKLVTDRQRKNADAAVRPEMNATKFLTGHIKLRFEKDMADIINNAANWSSKTSLTSTLAWNANTTLSNPITFADTATATILSNTGKVANLGLIDNATYLAAKEHVSVVDRVKYTSADSVTPAMLAKLMNVEKLVVAKGVYNSGQEGLADSMTKLFTDLAWFAYVAPSMGLEDLTAIATFSLQGQGLEGGAAKVRKWREENRSGDFIEVEYASTHKIVASDAAYHIANTIQ